jgi:hypothetical protein
MRATFSDNLAIKTQYENSKNYDAPLMKLSLASSHFIPVLSTLSSLKHPQYVSFLNGEKRTITLTGALWVTLLRSN